MSDLHEAERGCKVVERAVCVLAPAAGVHRRRNLGQCVDDGLHCHHPAQDRQSQVGSWALPSAAVSSVSVIGCVHQLMLLASGLLNDSCVPKSIKPSARLKSYFLLCNTLPD